MPLTDDTLYTSHLNSLPLHPKYTEKPSPTAHKPFSPSSHPFHSTPSIRNKIKFKRLYPQPQQMKMKCHLNPPRPSLTKPKSQTASDNSSDQNPSPSSRPSSHRNPSLSAPRNPFLREMARRLAPRAVTWHHERSRPFSWARPCKHPIPVRGIGRFC
jgi:hypothetical protein